MSGDFKNKTVVITGAGSGLGKAASIAFAEQGANVCIVGRSREKLIDTQRKIEAHGGACLLISIDLGTADAGQQVVEKTLAKFNGIDVLCNIAAEVKLHRLEDITPEDWQRMLASNLTAPLFLMQAAMPFLKISRGNVVNVSSTGGVMGQAYLAPYTATKFGLEGLTKSLAMEFINEPVRINTLAPGPINTEMAHNVKFPDYIDMNLFNRYSGFRAPSDVQDIVEPLLFLASDKARAIHGACYMVDGGVTTG